MISFEHRLKTVMEGLSVRKSAERLGVPPTTLQQYLKGRMPPADFIVLVCERWGVNPWWLLTGVGEMRKSYTYENDGIPVVAEQFPFKFYSEPAKKIIRALPHLSEEDTESVLKYVEERRVLAELKAGK